MIVDSVKEVKEVIKECFEEKFRSSNSLRHRFQTPMLYKLNVQESMSLKEPFTVDEMQQVVFEGDRDKCPGPDGFNLKFMKKSWDILGEGIVLFIQYFHKGGKLPKIVTASFIALIPKCENPLSLEEYRPICLISRLLKIVSRILAARMRNVIGKLISNNQMTLAPGIQFLNGVLVTNEILDYINRNKKECLVFKLDFAQVYDCVDWNYLRLMLRSTGFGGRWMDWMEVVVFTSSM